MPISINWNPGKKKREKEQDIIEMAKWLSDVGMQPEEINAIASKYRKTGAFELPTTRQVPTEGPATEEGYLPAPASAPIKFRKKPVGGWVMNEQGQWEWGRSQGKEMVDLIDEGGKKVGETTRGAIRVKTPSNGQGSGGQTTERDPEQVAAAQKALAVYAQAAKEGKVSEELRRLAVQAAEYLGLSVEDLVTQKETKGFFGIGAKPEVRTRVPSFGGQTKVINGVTYKKESDGKWHRQQ